MIYSVECRSPSFQHGISPIHRETAWQHTHTVLDCHWFWSHQHLHHEFQVSKITCTSNRSFAKLPKILNQLTCFFYNRKNIHSYKSQQKHHFWSFPAIFGSFKKHRLPPNRGFQVSKHFQRVYGWTWMVFKMVVQPGELRNGIDLSHLDTCFSRDGG